MVRDIRRRLAALAACRRVCARKFELFINQGDGLLRNRTGQVMTREAFDAAFPNARRITLDIFGDRLNGESAQVSKSRMRLDGARSGRLGRSEGL